MNEESIKFFDSELKIFGLLWEKGDLAAGEISKILERKIGWKRTTTYTVIKKCVYKKGIERIDLGFVCHPLVSKQDVQQYETEELISKLFYNSNEAFLTSFVSNQGLTAAQIEDFKVLIEKLTKGSES